MVEAFNEPGYHVFKSYISKEDAKMMSDFLKENCVTDPGNVRPHYRWSPIPGGELCDADFFNSPSNIKLDWDPKGLIFEMLLFAKNFFLENYKMWGDFYLHRVHGNIMDPGAELEYHTDEDPNAAGDYPGDKRSYIADLFVNDDHEGGEIGFSTFQDQATGATKIKPEPGDLILFSGYNKTHGVEQIISGSRANVMGVFHDAKDFRTFDCD